jgi:hypothetical protein
MSFDVVRSIIRRIIDLISDGRYDLVLRACSRSRLTEIDIEGVVVGHGRTFIHAPADFDKYLDAVLIEGRSVPTWSVRVPLWTREEGRSDLTLELTIAENPDEPNVELDDLKVL